MNDNTAPPAPMSQRKDAIRLLHDELAPERMRWLEKGAFFHEEDLRYLKFLIPESLRILSWAAETDNYLRRSTLRSA